MTRCAVIIKSGSRSGRKCGRHNCPYHTTEDQLSLELTESTESTESTEPSPVEENTPVEEKIPEPSPVEENTPEEEKIPEPSPVEENTPEEKIPEPSPVEENTPVEEKITEEEEKGVERTLTIQIPDENGEIPASSPITQVIWIPEATFQLDSIVSSPISDDPIEDTAVEEVKVIVKDMIDNILKNIIQEILEEPDDFIEVEEEDCYEPKDTIIIDTETIGLPPHKSVPMSSKDWERCRAVQIAWKKVFSDGKEVCRNYIIRPEGFIVTLTSIHGITHQMAMDTGVSISSVLKQLTSDLKSVVTVVGHNIDFDYQIIAYEFFRSGLPNKWASYHRDCTMALAKRSGICEGPIRLGVLYELCFGSVPEQTLHQADVDVEVCTKIYFYLLEKMKTKLYFKVEYKDKDVFKFLGGLWDAEQRKWYTYDCHRFLSYLKKWFPRY